MDFLSFGCHNLTGGSSLRKSVRLIHCAIDHGITRFDVAPSYGLGTAESVLGIAIRNRNSAVAVTTKFGIEPPKFGRFLAWGSEPYRRLRPILRKNPPGTRSNPDVVKFADIRLMASLERSLRAMAVDRVDTLLTYELVDPALIKENLEDIELARNRGQLNLFGCSGERVAVEKMISAFCDVASVVQVSVSDWDVYGALPIVRLFGAVQVLKPLIAYLASRDKSYAEALISVLAGVQLLEDRLTLGAVAAARTLFPRSTLLVNTRNEPRIGLMVRYLSDGALLAWGEAHRDVHRRMLNDRARN